jgi:type I restriction enzyme S subunit
VDERTDTGQEELLSVSHVTGVSPRSQKNVTMFMAESYAGHKLCQVGDLVINTMWAWMAALGVARQTGIVSPSYAVYRPIRSNLLLPDFVDHLLRTKPYASEYVCRSTGIRSSRLRLYPESFLDIPIICPSYDEQEQILSFLQIKDQAIRRFIRSKRRLIELLNEQKQAIIHRAVTRGLNPNVCLKPSGIDWLGDVPQHWEVLRAKAVCSEIIDCKNRTPEAVDDGEYLVVRTTCIRNGQFDPYGGYKTDKKNYQAWTARGAPCAGDVFFTREAPAGEACLVPERDDLCMGQRMMYFRPDPELLDPRFLLLNIYGPLTRTYVELATNGSTVGHLRLGQVYALPILWCPLEEQKAIIKHVGSETQNIDRTRIATQREIDLLREYRTRLIADVVTGKLDVRGMELSEMDETAMLGDFDDSEEMADLAEDTDEVEVIEEEDAG